MSDYGGDIAITDGTKVWNINSMGGKYAYNPANMASDIVTVESDCVLEIYASTNGANVYFPYIAVSKVVETEFKDFSINTNESKFKDFSIYLSEPKRTDFQLKMSELW